MAKAKESEMDGVLRRFMQEMFDFNALCKVGFFKKEWRRDYKAQAAKVCEFFGYETVYEYGKDELRAHISTDEYPRKEPFLTVIPSIYD